MADDFVATISTTGHVAVGGSATGQLEIVGDTDWFSVSLSAGRQYTFALASGATNGLQDPYLRLFSIGGTTMLAENDDANGLGSQVDIAITATGTYYLEASSGTNPDNPAVGTRMGNYVVSASTTGDDYSAGVSTTGRITVGAQATGQLETFGDGDWFAINLEAGKQYTFTLNSGTSDGLTDPSLSLHRNDGSLVTSNDDFDGLNSEITVTAATTGTYYLGASSGQNGTGTGSYTLSASLPITVPPPTAEDDYSANVSTAGRIVAGDVATGKLETHGDSDWFAINLEATKQYVFTLNSSATDGLTDPQLHLYRSDGSSITSNDDFDGLNSQISYTPSVAGTFYLGASSGTNGSGTGAYVLNSSLPIADDYSATIKTTGLISPGSSTSGQLELAGDDDWFAISLTTGQEYTFTLVPGSSNGLDDPFLSLYGSSGALLTSNDDSSLKSSQIIYTPASTGTYYLGASSGATGSGTGTYSMASSYPTVNGVTVVTGASGNDSWSAATGNSAFDGGQGTDTVVFSGNRSQYTVVKTPAGYKVFDNSGTDGVDTLASIEKLQFADQTIDTTVVSAGVYATAVQQLYIAYFGRPADTGGLLNQENTLLAAGAPTDIAGLTEAYKTNSGVRGLIELFGTSAESARLYAGSATADFVTAIYTHVLNRAPLQAGLDFWTNAIDTGVLTKSNAALSIMNGALENTTTQGLLDASAVINKVAVATNFTFNIDTALEVSGYVGQAAAAKARDMLQAVNETSEPVGLQSTVAATLASLVSTSAIPSGMESADHDAISLVGIAQLGG